MTEKVTMRGILVCFLILAISMSMATVFGQEEKLVLSLQNCEERAFEKSQIIADANLSLELSHAKRAQARNARWLPRLEFRNVWGPINRARGSFDESGVIISPDTSFSFDDIRFFTQIDFNLVQPLYTFGKLSNLSSAASQAVVAEEANVRKEVLSLQLKVRELYWGLILGTELVAVIEEAQNEVKNAISKIREKLDEGSDDFRQSDLWKLQIFEYEINKRHGETTGKIKLAKSALRTAIGLEEATEFELDKKVLEPLPVTVDSVQYYTDAATYRRPEVEQLSAGIQARRALINVATSDYWPQIFFGGQVAYNYAMDRFDSNNPFVYDPTNYFRPGFVIGFHWNLNFVQTRDKARVALVEYNRLRQSETLLEQGIRLEVEATYMELQQIEKNMRASRQALRASENWLRSEGMVFDIGVGEVKDFIDAYKANATMRAEHLENIFEFNVTLAKLGKSTGLDLYEN
jgi:outer membrane protein TolC